MNAPKPAAARAPLMSLADAMHDLLGRVQALSATETVATFDADRRVLAQDLTSALQVPPNDNSSMDGYAVRVADITEKGVVLPVSQRIPAGHAGGPLQPGSVRVVRYLNQTPRVAVRPLVVVIPAWFVMPVQPP